MTSTDRRGAAGRLRLTALAMTASLLAAACGGDADQVAVTPPETAAPAGSSQSPTEPPPVEPPPAPGSEPAPPPGPEAPAPPPSEPQAPPEPPDGGDSPEQVDPPQPPPESAAPPDPSEGGSPGAADPGDRSGSPQPPEPSEAARPSEPQERSEPRDDPSPTGDDSADASTAPPVGPVGSATDDSADTAQPSTAPPPPEPPPPPPPTHPAPEPPTWYPVTVLVAKDNVNGIVPVYDAPNGNRLSFRDGELWSYTYRGNRLVLHVVDGIPGDEWVQAELPIRPNGARGWIRTADFNWSTVRHHILIDVSDRLVALFEGDELVTYTRAIVGTERTPTPALSGFIVEKLPNHDRRYGSDVVGDWILMLSFFSEALDSFSGGLPRIALHGTHIPNEVGTAQSNGCIRIPNNIIEFIARTAPLGTVVNITA